MADIDAESIALDRLDRQIIHALLLDGRVAFRRLAQMLGSSEQTVARRYRRMREAGVLNVVGLVAPLEPGLDWLVRVGVRPGSATAVAGALAAREDVAWVSITGGGAEVVCGTRPRSRGQDDALLLDRLPASGRVTSLVAHAILNRFAGSGHMEWSGFGDPLSDAQVAELVAERASIPDGVQSAGPRGTGDARLEPGDAALIAELRRDGRAGYAQLAQATGWSAGRVTRRLTELLASGAIYIDLETAPEMLGFPTVMLLWITVAPSELEAVGRRLASLRETSFVAALTGPANLHATILTRSTAEFYELITRELEPLPAIRTAETTPVVRRVKQAASIMRGPRLPDPV